MKQNDQKEFANEISSKRVRSLGKLCKQFVIVSFTLAATSLPVTTWSGDLILSKSPLFLKNAVQPNIFFMVDDSGSMHWEVLKSSEATNIHPSYPTGGDLDFSPDNRAEFLELCRGYNVLAYNPTITYAPWEGYDDAGNAYGPAYVSESSPNFNVLRNPYYSGGSKRNLAATTGTYRFDFVYFPWNDTGVIGAYEYTDSNTDGNWDPGEPTECGVGNATGGVTFASLSLAQKKNFANWYSYYRQRDYVMKAALNSVIFSSRHRVGLGTLWNTNSVGTPIKDIDNITVPINTTANTDKLNLYQQVGRIRPGGMTPLRRRLQDVGEYYSGTSNSPLFGSTYNHTNTFTSRSPILNQANGGECQQNFTILMTDGFWNQSNPSPSVGNADANTASPFDGGVYADTFSNTLADVAMSFYKGDLAGTLANDVPTISGVDENDAQHMVTYTVAFGLKGQIRETYNGAIGDTANGWPGWPSPFTGNTDKTRIDDVWHAAFNGRGLYLNASNPQELIKSFNNAISDIGSRTGSASGVSVTSGTISSATRIYSTQFSSSNWSGSLLSYQFIEDTTVAPPRDVIVPAADFSGGTTNNAILAIESQDWDLGKTILSYNGTRGIPFRWPVSPTSPGANEMSPSQVTAMVNGDVVGGGLPDFALASQRVNFLRGDHTNEIVNGGTLRTRERDVLGCTTGTCAKTPFVLGDTVHSSPLFVAEPPFAYPDYLEGAGNEHYKFRVANSARTPIIYFGANDGMLHGIDAATGEEKIAYVPSSVYNRLPALTNKYYNHEYYVDESPEVGDVFYGGAWSTVLVSALRGGGQGVFALDITDPSTFSEAAAASTVLWEFTDADDRDLGYTFGRPSFAKMQNGRWYAVFGNGYNNTEADSNVSTSGNAVLYLIDVETKAMVKIDTGAGKTSSTDGSHPNGLARPALVDVNGDYIIDYIYAGDLQGNMWKFDVTGNGPAQWRNASKRSVLFTAKDSLGVPQPITTRPEIDLAPAGPQGLFVIFGTGQYMEANDITSAQGQTMYGIWDQAGSSNSATVEVFRNELVTQTLTYTVGITDKIELRINTLNTIDTWGNGGGVNEYMGWKIELPETGERVIASPLIQDNKVIFITITPSDSACDPGGSSWFMAVNVDNGGQTPDDVIDVNKDGGVDDTDRDGQPDIVSGVRNGALILGEIGSSDVGNTTSAGASVNQICASASTSRVITSDSTGKIDSTDLDRPQNAFRQGWRQVQ